MRTSKSLRGGNPARHVLLRAGIPVEADDYSINMNCSSGLRAITSLPQDLLRDDVEVGVAVGTESMSNTPYLLDKARRGYRLGNGVLIDFLADYILGDAGPMAEKVAAEYKICTPEPGPLRRREPAQGARGHRRRMVR